jgi:DNA repair protein RadA/Sms
VNDPAMDLSVIAAIISSHENTPLPHEICFSAEVGLTGKIRPVIHVERRISEAEKMGFRKIFISRYNPEIIGKHNMEIIRVSTLEELYSRIFT